MATKNHQKLDGAAKRFGRTTRTRSLAAIVAGATLSGALAAGGALGFIGEAKAITALSGTTFLDLDGNGQLDAAPDRLIGGVTVTAFDSSGTNAGQVVSLPNGTWEMAANGSGPYRIEFSNLPKSTYEGFSTQVTNLQFSNTGASFGLYAKLNGLGEIDDVVDTEPVQLGDRVWLDSNSNGIQDQGEPGIAGVRVELLIDGGPYIENGQPRTSTTDGNGNYVFSNIAPNRNYSIRVAAGQAPLANYTLTTQKSAGSTRYNDSDPALVGEDALAVAVAPKLGADMSYDFGYKPKLTPTLYCVGDQVWEDTNKDGLFSAGEPGIGGVNVTLIDNAGNPVAGKSAVTAANGTWNICGLANGDYRVRFSKPDGYEFTKQATAANDGQSSADANGVSLPGTVKDKDCVCLDAGLIKNMVAPKLKLGDLVFIDTDRDGRQTPVDTAVSGATVRLLNEAGTVIATTTTDANGKYLFTDLAPGKYQVQFTRPAGTTVTPTTVNVGDKENDSNARPQFEGTAITDVINLEADDLTIDAGWVTAVVAPTYCLGDLVFNDLNGNGIREDNEPGVNGVTVTVTNSAGGTGSTVTNNGGAWKICGLIAGDYTVAFIRPAGYEFTLQGSGNNRSNVDATGKTGKVTITNADVLSVDAGVKLLPVIVVVQTTVPPVTVAPTTAAPVTTVAPAPVTTVAPAPVSLCIGDKVFLDPTGAAKDGKGISGVTVTLVKADGSTAAATTDSNGIYKFCSLGAGSYTVKVNPATLPAGAIPTYDLAGRKNNEASLSLTNADNVDVDFGYKLPAATVLAETITTAPAEMIDEPIAFTGSNTTTTMLWGLALLMMGMGIAGLMVDRRRNAFH